MHIHLYYLTLFGNKCKYCFMIIIIIIETIRAGQSGKNKVAYKLLSQPLKNLHHGKLEKTHSATIRWLHPWTHPAFRYQTQCSEGHSTIAPEPAGKT